MTAELLHLAGPATGVFISDGNYRLDCIDLQSLPNHALLTEAFLLLLLLFLYPLDLNVSFCDTFDDRLKPDHLRMSLARQTDTYVHSKLCETETAEFTDV